MTNINELSYLQCSAYFDPTKFSFHTTEEVPRLSGLITQERVQKALDFGLFMEQKGYNIYMSGAQGTGKTTYAKQQAQLYVTDRPAPQDWCYVYNFENPAEPIALSFPAGKGIGFQKDVARLVEDMVSSVTEVFSSDEYDDEKLNMLKELKDQKEYWVAEVHSLAEKYNFEVKTSNGGIYLLPIYDGKTISEKEFGELPEEVQDQINEVTDIVEKEAYSILKEIREIEKKAKTQLEQLENMTATKIFGPMFRRMNRKYGSDPKVAQYLKAFKKDAILHLDWFYDEGEESELESLVGLDKGRSQNQLYRYQVNVMVSHKKEDSPPVIVDYHPTYYKLVGSLEYEQENGKVTTDYMKIRPGLFHQANGGVLILQIHDILTNVQSWELVKRVLKTQEIRVENIREQLGLVELSTLQPEPIPMDVKVIVIGSEYLYHMLYNYDQDFPKLFKIKCSFEDKRPSTDNNIQEFIQHVATFCEENKAPHFTKEAVLKLLEYGTRLAGQKEYLSCEFHKITEILYESTTWAKLYGKTVVGIEDIERALQERKTRLNRYEEQLQDLMVKNVLLIDTESEVVGQINGLSVLDFGDYCFGKPSRITASVSMGRSGIINIEKESSLSGKIHDKGVLVLAGYIGSQYSQDVPFAVSIQICFEQLYSGVDGDSASSAELYAILSNLSGLPIKQGIAVTGSLNQKGEVQPVGGINEKIEGYFDLCKARGLTGKHGVMIPKQNVSDLVLNSEVVEAVKNGMFHIYPVGTINEGIEILMGVPAGVRNKNGNFPRGSVHYRVMKQLYIYAMNVVTFGKKPVSPPKEKVQKQESKEAEAE